MQGYLYGGPPWTVKCALCSGIVAKSLLITVGLAGVHVTFKPDGRLGDRFDAYRKAIEGAKYMGDDTNRIGLDKAAAAIERLAAAGFVLDMKPGVVEAATETARAVRRATGQALASAQANADAIDTRLRARGLSLFPFQRAGAAWLATKYGALLADQMGLGKTIEALAALPADAPAVVVGPAVAKGVWCNEIAAWRPDRTASMLSGLGSFRWANSGEVVVTNYDILRSAVEAALPEEMRSPTEEEQVSEPVAVRPGDELSLLQEIPEGLYQLRRADKKGTWKVLETVRSFQATLSSFQRGLLQGERAIKIGLTGSDRTILHSDPQQAELSVDSASVLLTGILALGRWAQRHDVTDPAPGRSEPHFLLVISGAAADQENWRSLQAWNEDTRLRELDQRRMTVPEGVERVRFHWRVSGAPQAFGVGYRSKSLSEQPPEGTVLIIDEAHACKSTKAERTRNVRSLSQAVRARKGRTWCLTATPMLKNPTELWNVLMLAGIAHEAFGSWQKFAHLMGGEQDGWGIWSWTGEVDPSVPELLRKVSLRRERSQVLPELPQKMWQTIPVDIDQTARKLCDEAEDFLRSEGIDLRGVVSAAQLSRINPLAFKKIAAARAALASTKIPAMLEIVESYEEQSEPLVVFSAHRAPIDLLGRRAGWAVITGDEDADERTAIAAAFQRGELKGVGLTIKAGGIAITLTRSAHALFVDSEWNPGLNDQAEDRICRIGQSRGCIIRKLVANHPLDARVEAILTEKRSVIDASVGASATAVTPMVEVGPDVDLDRIAAASRERLAAEARVQAEAARIAAQRAAEGEARRAELARQAEETKAREKAQERERKAFSRAKARGWVEEENHPERHPPCTDAEHWAAQALVSLSASDPDHAMEENSVGFNKGDSFIGHWLGLELPKGLTPGQWKLAIATCRKYHRQVGPCPDPTPTPTAEKECTHG
jgi:hypothetical protein